MSDFNDNIFDDFEEEPSNQPEPVFEDEEPPQPKRGQNRTFVIAVGVLGAIFLLILIAMAVFALIIVPQRNAAMAEQAAQINAANTATSVAATEGAFAQAMAATGTAQFVPSPTGTATQTPVVVFSTQTPEPEAGGDGIGAGADLNARTATVSALLTLAAGGGTTPNATQATQTAAAKTPTALPTTGFADEVGLPGLLGVAVLLVAVIALSRRLRAAAS
ncbi:hypothetical protein ADN00_03145 [Ornatilinea apprima]|uniref:Gram-positive cocci surface proteins LPxTG domain-containing protein n=1 Tax=Ornatilinea apprima TaxID=1134406 RepID=A0A0P6XB07_9CHLR|nr:hypothetical protein [Ornatilinea apprima]KPL79337.1 hypothetical protein ADN00_03145 [Ornatilinea apprima]